MPGAGEGTPFARAMLSRQGLLFVVTRPRQAPGPPAFEIQPSRVGGSLTRESNRKPVQRVWRLPSA